MTAPRLGGNPDSTWVARSDLRMLIAQQLGEETWLATDEDLTIHETDTTNVHGIADTSKLMISESTAAGGDLTGTYPNPTIGASKVNASKLGANSVETAKVKNEAITREKLAAALKEELEPIFNVKSATFGAKGDGATDDATAIQNAINAASTNGGVVFFPTGVYIIGSTLKWKSKVSLRGSGWDASEIKVKNGVNIIAIESEAYGAAGVFGCTCFDLRVNGNIANNPTGGTNFKLDGQSFTFEKVLSINCKGDGFNNQISSESQKETSGLDSAFIRCRAINCRGTGFRINAHDTILVDCQPIQCTETGFNQEKNCYMVDCHSWCYSSEAGTVTKIGYRFQGNATCINCVSEGASEAQVKLEGPNTRWFGGEVFASSGKPNVPCFEFNGGSSCYIDGPYVHNYGTGGAFNFVTNASQSTIRAHCFDPESKPAGVGTPSENIYFDITTGGSGGTGTMPSFRRTKMTFGTFEPGSVENNTIYVRTSHGRLVFKDGEGKTKYLQPTFPTLRNQDPWRPEGTKAENFSRTAGDLKNLAAVLVSGTLYVAGGMIIPADEAIGTIHIYTATTAAFEPTHSWVVLMDKNRKILARSADKTTTALGANSKLSYTLEASYTPTNQDEAVYVGFLVVATTPPTLRGKEAENNFPYNQAPIISGTSNTGLTTPLAVGETATALTGTQKLAYFTVN